MAMPFLLQLIDIPAVLFLRCFPAANFGVGSRLEHGVLRRLVQRTERLLVDDHRILRQPGLRVVEGLDAPRRSWCRSRSTGDDMYESTTPVASACVSSEACTVTGCAPTSSGDAPVAGL
jgi:hypothetical protein